MSPLLEKIAEGNVVLTVNSRLALHLQTEYEAWQTSRGHTSWPTASIISLNAWLRQQWQELLFLRQDKAQTLLSDEQVLVLWQSVITGSEQGALLLNAQPTARAVMRARQQLRQWRLPIESVAHEANIDVQAFHGWASEFASRCRKRRWLDGSALMDEISDAIAEGALPLSGDFFWLGFDDLTPQQAHLIEITRSAGASVDVFESTLPAEQACLLPCNDQTSEINAVAQWLRRLLDDGDSGNIGIVVPELASLRREIERIFDEVLLPGRILDLDTREARPYNISLGLPLATLPMVHAALMILRVGRGRLPLNDWSRLLLSPFLGGADKEMALRAQLDAVLRRHGEATFGLKQLIYWAGQRVPCPQLVRNLEQLQTVIETAESRQSAAAWRTTFLAMLKAMGWPGDRSLDSEAYQTAQAWQKVLASFTSIDTVISHLNASEALRHLRQSASTTLFQPQSKGQKIQVLGMLEAAGLSFDHCWVMGLHDGVWPPSPQPNPFLPIELQREHGMPHASAERELAYARHINARLLAAAPRVMVSYPRREGDSDLRPSPLIATLPPALPQDSGITPYRQHIFEASELESFSDWQAPELPPGVQARGGTSVFKDQSACPFRAFARHRLGAEALAEPVAGLDAAERGSLVHRVLELFWLEVHDLATLNSFSDEALDTRVAKVVAVVIEKETEKYPHIFTQRFTVLESARLQRLVMAWLQLERLRPSFTVQGVEVERLVSVAGIDVKVMADRIDRLEGGSEVIIDYKTGRVSTNDWFGERPDEPQLPLYAISHENEVAAVTFGVLRPGDVAFKGVGGESPIAKGIKPGAVDWGVQQGLWRDVLTRLAEDFRRGHAEVDPKDAHKAANKACMYCDLPSLCRINELNGLGLDDEEAADE